MALVATYVSTVETKSSQNVLEDMSDTIALAHNIATSTLRNLVWSESRWNPKADNGKDRGLTQINRKAWPDVTDVEAFDPEFALNFAADKIAHKEEYRWVVCSCWALVKTRIPTFPSTKEIIVNSSKPEVGSVVIENFNGINHYAFIEKVDKTEFTVYESNYHPCLTGNRIISINDKHIVGYWKK